MIKLTRRAFVARTTAGVATAGAMTVPALAEGNPDAELIALGKQYVEALAATNVETSGHMSDEVTVLLSNHQFDIERRIVATPALTPAGLAVKLAVLWEVMAPLAEEADGPTADSAPEVKILWTVIGDVERMARGDRVGAADETFGARPRHLSALRNA